MGVDLGYKNIEKFRGGVQWYLKESKNFISCFGLKLENESGKVVFLIGQSITLRLSVKEVYFLSTKWRRPW